MGIIKNGILGGFRKKTGTVVGAFWRSLDVIRALPRSSGKAPTEKQLNQQQKFKLITGFLSNFGNLIDIGFYGTGQTATPMNLAVRYHLANAVTGVAPDFELDFSALKISTGKLALPLSHDVDNATPATLSFTWSHTEPNDKLIDASDQVMVMVYNPVKDRFIKVTQAAMRSAMAYELVLPATFSGDEVVVYLAFTSAIKRGLSSDTICLGNITIS